eukprot:TRINITY_DN9589_c0_g1_i9.p4 TRINITY_DN9589_c0_g1~~TRINITY_DN9589_c0_g1_i9.p4  ORF type:complete len:102 (+),score=9.42 TRINITY_DN9589_c0_g1_i9:14-319(+)
MTASEVSKDPIEKAINQRRSKGTLRLTIEFELLKYLPTEYRIQYKELQNVLLIQVKIKLAGIRPLEESMNSCAFDIIVAPDFPLSPPKIRSLSSVSLLCCM